MPLYTLWSTDTVGEIVFAAVHCTGGDILIAKRTGVVVADLWCRMATDAFCNLSRGWVHHGNWHRPYRVQ